MAIASSGLGRVISSSWPSCPSSIARCIVPDLSSAKLGFGGAAGGGGFVAFSRSIDAFFLSSWIFLTTNACFCFRTVDPFPSSAWESIHRKVLLFASERAVFVLCGRGSVCVGEEEEE
jgi:hypothetical protein